MNFLRVKLGLWPAVISIMCDRSGTGGGGVIGSAMGALWCYKELL